MKAKAAHTWDRAAEDWYVEPVDATLKLLGVEGFDGPIHDPCCGGGNIVTAALMCGYEATGTDIVARAPSALWWGGRADYHEVWPFTLAPNVISNPPFYRAKGLEEVCRLALTHTPGKIAMFAPLGFLAGHARGQGLYADNPPDRIWILSKRVSCPTGAYIEAGKTPRNGTADWCWLVWNDKLLRRVLPPRIGWLTDKPEDPTLFAKLERQIVTPKILDRGKG